MQSGATRILGEGPSDKHAALQRLKTHFLASLNHEIRTPLTGILGMVDLLLETPLDDTQREYVMTARMCAEELLALLDSALEYSALSAGRLPLEEAEFELPELLETLLDQHQIKAHAKGLTLRWHLDSLPALVIGDAVRIRQIVSQLLANAIKFTVQGEVHLYAAARQDGAGRCVLEITVRDTGIGIPPEQLPHLFESFAQLDHGWGRRYSGLGLGLATVRQLLELMGGGITVESQPGQGSTFRIAIPLRVVREAPDRTPSTSRVSARPAEKRILLVEDDVVAQRIVAHMLSRSQFQVDAVGSGDAAIAVAAARFYDLILMDLQMPGKDGVETATEIRRLPGYEQVPIVALTAHTTEEYRTFTREHGFQGFLSKPVRAEELLAAVRLHLQSADRPTGG